ncbi:alpha/beta-hydrolase [Dothidotthia symphoricarpi CBS 119687]|uniref:Alpha/beta-hydrolase n=1 Tax=Dothidotthia symphoricarpi CBS 119687 TaxID=1392245 RepID=A0A6A6A8K5_9PLEO|nr:alpha/beta-hydrolase [Dothidotthia symphoricarpi CBS 119687]KAF2127138.1 alpha/beta-hydrolase [Dothidotthia symphoricarpi CBS 119687]
MSCENCKSGFAWNGTPTGTESTIGKNKAYVTGDSKDTALLIIPDVFGWTFTNARILADHYAKEANVTAYVIDCLGGEVVDPDALSDPELRAKFDLPAFIGRNSREIRWPEIKAAAQALKAQYSKVGAIGFCYGGWAAYQLGADPSLVDAVSSAHPSLLEKADLDALKVPVQVLVPEHDPFYTEEFKQYTLAALPKTGVPWEYVYFPGLKHGFAARGDPNDKAQKDGLERAKRSAVSFFNEFLH